MTATEKQIANLKPAAPGEVRNPKGVNQFSYRQDAEKHLAEWCEKYGQDLIDKLCDDARDGNRHMMKLALERILPAVKEVDLRVPGADPASLASGLAGLAAGRRTNGHDRDAEHPGANGTSGDHS